jgi:hypothetical protein
VSDVVSKQLESLQLMLAAVKHQHGNDSIDKSLLIILRPMINHLTEVHNVFFEWYVDVAGAPCGKSEGEFQVWLKSMAKDEV